MVLRASTQRAAGDASIQPCGSCSSGLLAPRACRAGTRVPRSANQIQAACCWCGPSHIKSRLDDLDLDCAGSSCLRKPELSDVASVVRRRRANTAERKVPGHLSARGNVAWRNSHAVDHRTGHLLAGEEMNPEHPASRRAVLGSADSELHAPTSVCGQLDVGPGRSAALED